MAQKSGYSVEHYKHAHGGVLSLGHLVGQRLLVTSVAMMILSAPLAADSVNNTNFCINGAAAAYDYSEFAEDFATGEWKSYSGVQIISESNSVVLTVTDQYGSSICTNTANLTTQCKFQADFQSTFTINVDNTPFSTAGNFKICTF